MIVTIEKIVYPGKSFSRINGKVVFLDQGLPGEVVEIDIVSETKGYIQAKVIKVIDASLYRKQALCSHYRVCSVYQYIDYSQQVEIKKQQIKEIICHRFDIDCALLHFRQSPQIWGYRNKIKVKIIRQNSLPHLAYNLPGTIDKFIPIDRCFLSPDQTNLFMSKFIKILRQQDFSSVRQLTIKENKNNELLVCVCHDDSLDIHQFSLVFESLIKQPKVAGVVLANEERDTQAVIYGDDFFRETIDNKQFLIGSFSFFQINTHALNLLVGDLRDNLILSKDTVLADLYCGVGIFGILLAEQVKQVIGAEIEPENFLFLEKNIKINGITNFDLHLCDCNDRLISIFKKNIDIAIIDPPRKGAGVQVCEKLIKSKVSTIVYISCDPSTLARDLKILLSAYKVRSLYVYDFFPHTPHIETMVILDKENN